jgi:hypothetical protein
MRFGSAARNLVENFRLGKPWSGWHRHAIERDQPSARYGLIGMAVTGAAQREGRFRPGPGGYQAVPGREGPDKPQPARSVPTIYLRLTMWCGGGADTASALGTGNIHPPCCAAPTDQAGWFVWAESEGRDAVGSGTGGLTGIHPLSGAPVPGLNHFFVALCGTFGRRSWLIHAAHRCAAAPYWRPGRRVRSSRRSASMGDPRPAGVAPRCGDLRVPITPRRSPPDPACWAADHGVGRYRTMTKPIVGETLTGAHAVPTLA